MSRPADKPPAGLDNGFVAVWRTARAAMRRSGVWDPVLRPFLDEYVWALQAASRAREQGFHSSEHRASRRAMAMADLLALTPRGRRAAGLPAVDAPVEADPFAEFGAVVPISTPSTRRTT